MKNPSSGTEGGLYDQGMKRYFLHYQELPELLPSRFGLPLLAPRTMGSTWTMCRSTWAVTRTAMVAVMTAVVPVSAIAMIMPVIVSIAGMIVIPIVARR